jgi:putative ABC transport system permease protein
LVWSESAFVSGGGLALGAVIGGGLSLMLVKVLTGVFDPRPTRSLSVGPTCSCSPPVLAAVAAAGTLTLRALRRPAITEVRDLWAVEGFVSLDADDAHTNTWSLRCARPSSC